MVTLRFLGTGPARGRPGQGRSHRTESSLLVRSDDTAILIDATRDLVEQARLLPRVDLVLITHSHRDASGGVYQLDRRLRSSVELLSSRATVRRLKERYRHLSMLELTAVSSGHTTRWRDWRITSLVVPHSADCTTLAWRLEHAGVSIVYASDVARLTAKLAALCAGCNLLVLDGAMWRRRIFSHLEIQSTAPIVARWPVDRILFTQIGRSTPAHEPLERWLRRVDPRIGAAYDGLELQLTSSSGRRRRAGRTGRP
ncbi:MAG TPA: MBL fold metallo-hydrolase [Kofleriaceae bacterium]|nr:MBL fold metallo-hydrolase [Kofleriaceae bacterium]